ncbi:hypothetical protein I302_105473 [Kwoniella bestiolae CBS 10118]|uniref:Uncharacterized protein n=1 Tax=Kwoniella bestiolae CBS 10118 TaxID=1296100 RepID=A0A1B9FT76_9TREE|nr:hypothetical protein I302_08755 [Kwoniella bestiolae CBS 10118]OCF21974.1 hypothetical protein I302_08755 [Kwoniella bestiolae CBS 10118]
MASQVFDTEDSRSWGWSDPRFMADKQSLYITNISENPEWMPGELRSGAELLRGSKRSLNAEISEGNRSLVFKV